MKKIDGRSLDILKENIEKMKQIFPEAFTEDKIDFEKLQIVLGEYKEDESERYDFTWNGKRDAIRISQTPTTGTLRPDKENSKDWDETENLYIEGDNLEVLKILQKPYHSKIKMIYIDPPYNTGKDFVYKDNYKDNMKNYLEYTGQLDSEGRRMTTNSEASGRYHTDWLNMMYPRLRLARNLLKDDGVIFISIDDNEVYNLKKICDEIFGEENFINNIAIEMSSMSGPKVNNAILGKRYPKIKETLLIYSKDRRNYKLFIKSKSKTKWDNEYNSIIPELKENELEAILSLKDMEDINKKLKDKSLITLKQYELLKKIEINDEWKEKNSYRIFSTKPNTALLNSATNMSFSQQVKYIKNPSGDLKLIRTDFNRTTKTARIELLRAKESMEVYMGDIWLNMLTSGGIAKEGGVDFNNGKKPLKLLKTIIESADLKDNDIVLDFFSGSSTTAHGVMDINIQYSRKIKFIMVQLPEEIDENSETFNAEYKTIADIGRERIRRSGKQLKEDNKDKEGIEDLDIGFKAFKLDSSNIREWNPEYEAKDFDFESLVNNFVEGRTKEDILYEIMLKYGIDLTTPMEEHSIDEKTIYDIGFGTLYICLDNYIDEKIVEKIISLNKESEMERARVVFKDTGFKNDEVKLNAKLTLKNSGIEEVLSI